MSVHQTLLKSILLGLLSGFAGCGGSQQDVASATASNESPEPTTSETEVSPDDSNAAEQVPDREFGKFVRIDLITSKPEKAAEFYEKLLGWTMAPIPGDGPQRFIIKNKGHELARIHTLDSAQPIPAGWMSWISVEDIDDMMRDVPANGGSVLAAPRKSANGRQAVLQGPTGGVFGVVQLDTDATNDRALQPGDFVLSQLWTKDFEAALRFYSVMGNYSSLNVKFGKTKYSIMQGDGTARAVIRQTPPGRATRWIPFVLSADVDAMAKAAKSLGATVVTQPREVPTLGRVAVIEAPTGGVLGFIQPPKGASDDATVW